MSRCREVTNTQTNYEHAHNRQHTHTHTPKRTPASSLCTAAAQQSRGGVRPTMHYVGFRTSSSTSRRTSTAGGSAPAAAAAALPAAAHLIRGLKAIVLGPVLLRVPSSSSSSSSYSTSTPPAGPRTTWTSAPESGRDGTVRNVFIQRWYRPSASHAAVCQRLGEP